MRLKIIIYKIVRMNYVLCAAFRNKETSKQEFTNIYTILETIFPEAYVVFSTKTTLNKDSS